MKGVAITYGDVAPEAKENFNIEVSEKRFNTISNLQKYNIKLKNYASPCELYNTVLDGTAEALPNDEKTANTGLWSKKLSNDDGTFADPITVTLKSEGQYSSQGFTFTFDKFNDIYPTYLTIQWFRETEDLTGEVEFCPASSMYFCKNKVENFNKVVIKFYSLNMPKNRLKLEVVDYGYGTVFFGDELRNVKISQSVDPISSEIKINTCDFTLDSKTDMVYSFQSKQPLTVSFNGELIATCFVKSSKRKAKFLWDINAEDYISVLDGTPFVGGIYNNVPASDILETIFKVAKVPYFIAENFKNVYLTGHIPYTACRKALMQVCFASMAVVNTANSDVVEVKAQDDEVKQKIPLNRIMQGQSFEESDTVTAVELTAHTFSPLSQSEREYLYKAEDSGTGENIFVLFSEPMQADTIEIYNGKILEKGANYAVINAQSGCQMWGQGYSHTTGVKKMLNGKVLASEKENVLKITSAALISPSNVNDVLQNCFNWLTKTNTVNLKIVVGKDVKKEANTTKWGEKAWGAFKWGENIVKQTVTSQSNVNLGEVIKAETEYLGSVFGRIVEQKFNLNGNIIVKEAVLK